MMHLKIVRGYNQAQVISISAYQHIILLSICEFFFPNRRKQIPTSIVGCKRNHIHACTVKNCGIPKVKIALEKALC